MRYFNEIQERGNVFITIYTINSNSFQTAKKFLINLPEKYKDLLDLEIISLYVNKPIDSRLNSAIGVSMLYHYNGGNPDIFRELEKKFNNLSKKKWCFKATFMMADDLFEEP